MFEIVRGDSGTVEFHGRLDSAQAEKARAQLEDGNEVRVIDLAALEYISSAGLGILLVMHKRLMRSGGALRLINVNNHISDVLRYSGFDKLFEVERAAG